MRNSSDFFSVGIISPTVPFVLVTPSDSSEKPAIQTALSQMQVSADIKTPGPVFVCEVKSSLVKCSDNLFITRHRQTVELLTTITPRHYPESIISTLGNSRCQSTESVIQSFGILPLFVSTQSVKGGVGSAWLESHYINNPLASISKSPDCH